MKKLNVASRGTSELVFLDDGTVYLWVHQRRGGHNTKIMLVKGGQA